MSANEGRLVRDTALTVLALVGGEAFLAREYWVQGGEVPTECADRGQVRESCRVLAVRTGVACAARKRLREARSIVRRDLLETELL